MKSRMFLKTKLSKPDFVCRTFLFAPQTSSLFINNRQLLIFSLTRSPYIVLGKSAKRAS